MKDRIGVILKIIEQGKNKRKMEELKQPAFERGDLILVNQQNHMFAGVVKDWTKQHFYPLNEDGYIKLVYERTKVKGSRSYVDQRGATQTNTYIPSISYVNVGHLHMSNRVRKVTESILTTKELEWYNKMKAIF